MTNENKINNKKKIENNNNNFSNLDKEKIKRAKKRVIYCEEC